MKRPFGFTLLAFALAWLTLAGFGNVFMGPAQGLLRVCSLAYGVAALATAFGLWGMRSWALTAYRAWACVVLLSMMIMQSGQFRVELPKFAGFACFMVLLLWSLAGYVQRTLAKNIECAGHH